MAGSSVLATLHSITSAKQEELIKQRDAIQSLKKNLLDSVEKEKDSKARVRLLVETSPAWKALIEQRDADDKSRHDGVSVGVSTGGGSRGRGGRGRGSGRATQVGPFRGLSKPSACTTRSYRLKSSHDELFRLASIDPKNLQRFLELAGDDASISIDMLNSWEAKLKHALDIQEVRYRYASLFSQMATERAGDSTLQGVSTPTSDTSMSVAEPVGRSEMQDQRKTWEAYALDPFHINTAKLSEALEDVFGGEEEAACLRRLRKRVSQFGRDLVGSDAFNGDVVEWTIKGLIQTDLLSDTQTTTLKEMLNNRTYLNEMADVLNMKLSSFENWSWETDAVPLEMRRQLNGKYRAYMHEEITQALFLHYIGIRWAVCFRRIFRGVGFFLDNKKGLSKLQEGRRDYFLKQSSGISYQLKGDWRSQYFMQQLPETEQQGTQGYGEDDLADEADQTAKSPLAVKQGLLHLLYTDAIIQDACGHEVVCLQSDFKWFGPSLSHDVIFTTLGFYGVSETWIDFFRKFLQAPLRFINDGPEGQIRTRGRGVPMSHALSDMMGEAVMFHLDYAVDKATGGSQLFRLHDDLLYWGNAEDTTKAWYALNKFCDVTGLELNEEKTGACRISLDSSVAARGIGKVLPKKSPKFGFLTLDTSTAQLTVDGKKVESHVKEFKRQLSATTSMFGWIQAYNSYIQFILNNLLAPANCLGRSHIDACLKVISGVHAALFPEEKGDLAAHVKKLLMSRFPTSAPPVGQIPTGFLHFPLALGGLELRNPFLTLQAMRYTVLSSPQKRIEAAIREDESDYSRLERGFNDQLSYKNRKWDYSLGLRDTNFMSREEYRKGRYEYSPVMLQAWHDLRREPTAEGVMLTGQVEALLSELPVADGLAISGDWDEMTPYWQAVVGLYGEEMGFTFGGLRIASKELLPMGLIGLWKGGKVRWEG